MDSNIYDWIWFSIRSVLGTLSTGGDSGRCLCQRYLMAFYLVYVVAFCGSQATSWSTNTSIHQPFAWNPWALQKGRAPLRSKDLPTRIWMECQAHPNSQSSKRRLFSHKLGMILQPLKIKLGDLSKDLKDICTYLSRNRLPYHAHPVPGRPPQRRQLRIQPLRRPKLILRFHREQCKAARPTISLKVVTSCKKM